MATMIVVLGSAVNQRAQQSDGGTRAQNNKLHIPYCTVCELKSAEHQTSSSPQAENQSTAWQQTHELCTPRAKSLGNII